MNNEYIEKYINLWKNLDVELDFNKYVSFVNDKDTYSKFIKEFPPICKENIDNIIDYIKKFRDIIEPINIYYNYINKKNINDLIDSVNVHKKSILDIIDQKDTFESKKRIYLGLLWFGFGFYISYFIIKIFNYKEYLSFFSLREASKNRYIVFLSASFIFYDGIFDDQNIDKNIKKLCIDYTKYFLEFLINNCIKKETPNTILDKYLLERKIKLDLNEKDILNKSNKILSVLFYETHKFKNMNILLSIYELFNAEITTSQIQHNKKRIDMEEILKCTIYKSSKSIYAIMQSILGDIDIKKNLVICENIYLFSFLTQLLDDFNDYIIDKEENNLTIFTSEDKSNKNVNMNVNKNVNMNVNKNVNMNVNININKLFNYIYLIDEKLNKISNNKDLIMINHYLNLSIFNYSLNKYDNKDYLLEIYNYIPFKNEDISYIRENKNTYIDDYDFDKDF